MLKGTSPSRFSQWERYPGLSIYKVLLQKCPAVLVLFFLPGSNLMIYFRAEKWSGRKWSGLHVSHQIPSGIYNGNQTLPFHIKVEQGQ
jgi:hypothetical protein